MKTKEKESLRNMNDAEVSGALRELEKKYFQLKFSRTASPIENPIQIRFLRRKMAFLKTIITGRRKTAAAAKKDK